MPSSSMICAVLVALLATCGALAMGNSTKVTLSTANTIPAIKPTGSTGSCTVKLNPANMTGTTSTSLINIKNFTVAHIHNGNATVNGPVVLVLYSKPIMSGTFTFGTTFNASSLNPVALGLPKGTKPAEVYAVFVEKLGTSQLYGNFHTSLHPDGELRAQI
ncbi:MAG: hypothetical protein WDW36_006367 [Sanguina aurantia]